MRHIKRSRLCLCSEGSEHPFHLLIKFNPIISIPRLMCSGGRWSLSSEPAWRISSTSAASLVCPGAALLFFSFFSFLYQHQSFSRRSTVKHACRRRRGEMKECSELVDCGSVLVREHKVTHVWDDASAKVAAIGPQRWGEERLFVMFMRSVQNILTRRSLRRSRTEWVEPVRVLKWFTFSISPALNLI